MYMVKDELLVLYNEMLVLLKLVKSYINWLEI